MILMRCLKFQQPRSVAIHTPLRYIVAAAVLTVGLMFGCKKTSKPIKNNRPHIQHGVAMPEQNNYEPGTPEESILGMKRDVRNLIGQLNSKRTLAQKVAVVNAFIEKLTPSVRGLNLLGTKSPTVGKNHTLDALFTTLGELYFDTKQPYSPQDKMNRFALHTVYATFYPEFTKYLFHKAGKANFDQDILSAYGSLANLIPTNNYPAKLKPVTNVLNRFPGNRRVLERKIITTLDDHKHSLRQVAARKRVIFALDMAPYGCTSDCIPLVKFYTTNSVAMKVLKLSATARLTLKELQRLEKQPKQKTTTGR